MNRTSLTLDFATNMFGALKPEIKTRLQAVIDKPCQETWEDAYSIIINGSGRMETLWNAIHRVKPDFCHRKKLDSPWSEIPTSEEIIEAIKLSVFKNREKETISKEVFTTFYS